MSPEDKKSLLVRKPSFLHKEPSFLKTPSLSPEFSNFPRSKVYYPFMGKGPTFHKEGQDNKVGRSKLLPRHRALIKVSHILISLLG